MSAPDLTPLPEEHEVWELLGDLIDTSREFQAKAGSAGHEELLALAVKTDHLKHKIRSAYVQARWRAVEFERLASLTTGGAA